MPLLFSVKLCGRFKHVEVLRLQADHHTDLAQAYQAWAVFLLQRNAEHSLCD